MWKLAKKGNVRIFFDQFWDFTLKMISEICGHAFYEKLFGTLFEDPVPDFWNLEFGSKVPHGWKFEN